MWKALSDPKHIGHLKRTYVELAPGDLASVTTQAGMEMFISRLPDSCSTEQDTVDDNEAWAQFVTGDRKQDVPYIAMAIQLARFQQALLHTCNGQRFFRAKRILTSTTDTECSRN
jgi:hypothetical protein